MSQRARYSLVMHARCRLTLFTAICLARNVDGQVVPLVDLPAASRVASHTFGMILGLQPLADGGVLVNDAGKRQLLRLDASMTTRAVVLDSVAGNGPGYGARPAPLIGYVADSSVFVDTESAALLVLDPTGRVVRSIAAPKASDVQYLTSGAAYIDTRGRLVYRGSAVVVANTPPRRQASESPRVIDSLPILRADFDTRMVDTIGKVKSANGTRTTVDTDRSGVRQLHVSVNPLQLLDDWAVLSNGSVAFVRGRDYHVDLLTVDGQWQRGPRIPYEWRRLTDADKQRVVDSARVAIARMGASVYAVQESGDRLSGAWGTTFGLNTGQAERLMSGDTPPPPPSGSPATTRMRPPRVDVVPLDEIGDYLPALRTGAIRPDRAGNLWVLPTTSVHSHAGELIYDVLNSTGQLTHRVRVPLGRAVVGFGAGNVIYLVSGNRATGFTLERSTVPPVAR